MRYLLAVVLLTTAYGQLLPATVSTSLGYGDSYIVGVPNCIRPGLYADVYVDIVKRVNSVKVTVELLKRNTSEVLVSSDQKEVYPGIPEIISILMPREINYDWRQRNSDSYDIRVTGRSDKINFVNRTSVQVDNRNVTGFLQTDKAVYKPGQTVNFRAFSVKPNLMINKGVYNIEIRDPKGNKIRIDEGVNDPTGLIRGSLDLSDEPIYGYWTISANTAGTAISKSFEVKEYVLPRIEVTVTPPSFVTVDQPTVDVTITAKYTFGEDAGGSLLVTAKPLYRNWWFLRDKNDTQSILEQRIDNFKGTATVTFATADFLNFTNYRWSPISFEANLTESLTGTVTRGEESTRIYDLAEKVEYIQSSPRIFKPSLTYTAYVKVTQQDGSPIKPQSEILRVTVQQSYYVNKSEPVEENGEEDTLGKKIALPRSTWYLQRKTVNVTHLDYPIPANGLVEIIIPFIPSDAEDINIISTFKGKSLRWFASKAYSPSNSFIQMLVHRDLLKPGEKQKITLKSNVPIDSFIYLVTSRGRIVKTLEETSYVSNQHGFSFYITRDMAPRARVVAYIRTASGEIVADVVSFNVLDPFENKVSIGFDAEEVLPGADVKMTVKADPGSMVATLVLDKKVLLLKSGNDITEEEVTNSLWGFDSCSYYGWWRWGAIDRRRRKRSYIPWRYPYFSAGRDAYSVFNEAGLTILTDSLVYSHSYNKIPRNELALSATDSADKSIGDSGGSSLQQVDKLRTNFPETWLFMVEFADANGEVIIPTTAPDSITSWQATAFAFNDQSGFGITSEPAKLTVVKKFFANLYLPYSVIRGEEVFVQVNVFNYLPAEQTVEVELKGSGSFSSLYIDDAGNEYLVSGPRKQTITVLSGIPQKVVFPIKATELGEISLTATARSDVAADGLTQTIIVKPEGVPDEYNFVELVDLTSVSQYSATRNISYPPGLVPDSQKLGVKVVGDVLGRTFNNLDKLVQMSYGCGEQNMVKFAPTVSVSNYLKSVNQFTPERLTEAKNFINQGYQRQLNYKREDGSYSAFGNRDLVGSLWLTAFVVKSFNTAVEAGFITIDQNAINASYAFIAKRQLKDGSFNSSGFVHHKRMQGQSGKGFALTAYSLIALLENDNLDAAFTGTRDRALDYVKSYLAQATNLYELAIGVYVLHLAQSPQTDIVLATLESRATNKDGYTFWEVEGEPVYTWEPPVTRSKAASIEATSYVCLVYGLRRDTAKSSLCLSYLASQQNDYGGYVSTQDTVLAVQALGEIAPYFYSETPQGTITVRAAGQTATFNIDDSNRLDIQSATLPVSADSVTVTGSGTGIFLVSLSAKYNVDDDTNRPAFNITHKLIRDTPTLMELSICAKYVIGEASNMANVEIKLPTGFSLEEASREELLQYAKRVDTDNGKVLLYLDSITSNQTCVSVTALGKAQVNKPKPCPIKVFDYYSPDENAVDFYQLQSLNGDWCDASVCQKSAGCAINCAKRKRK